MAAPPGRAALAAVALLLALAQLLLLPVGGGSSGGGGAAADAAPSPPPPPWGRTPFFGDRAASEASDRLLRKQLDIYGDDLSTAVNKLRDMANAARAPAVQRKLLGNVDRVVECWQANLAALEGGLLRSFPRAPAIAPPCRPSAPLANASASSSGNGSRTQGDGQRQYEKASYDDVYQIFHHAARDWSSDGAPIRRAIYRPVVERLERAIAAEQLQQLLERQNERRRAGGSGENQTQLKHPWSVLVPGSGMGRLAYELARAGMSVTGLEVSTLMLSGAHAVLNPADPDLTADANRSGSESGSTMRLYPYIHDEYVNEVSSSDRFRPITIPDVQLHQQQMYLAFQQADFTEAFLPSASGQGLAEAGQYDAVVTCFLIDAVRHVEDAIAAIHAALRPGGLWLNVGPLQWHENAVLHLALDELLEVIAAAGFDVSEVEHMESVAYRSERDEGSSTRPLLYRPVRWVARRL